MENKICTRGIQKLCSLTKEKRYGKEVENVIFLFFDIITIPSYTLLKMLMEDCNTLPLKK